MVLLIVFVYVVFLPAFVIPQARRENKWDEEKMIDLKKGKKEYEDDDKRD